MPDHPGARGAQRLLASPDPLPAALLTAMVDQLPASDLHGLAARTDLPADAVMPLLDRALHASYRLPQVLQALVATTRGEQLLAVLHEGASYTHLTDATHQDVVDRLPVAALTSILTGSDLLAAAYVLAYSRRLRDGEFDEPFANVHTLLELTSADDWPPDHYDLARRFHVDTAFGLINRRAVANLVLSSSNVPFLTDLFLESSERSTSWDRLPAPVVAHLARTCAVRFLEGDYAGELLSAVTTFGTAVPPDVLHTLTAHPLTTAALRAVAADILEQHTHGQEAPESGPQFASRFIAAVTADTDPDTVPWPAILTLLSQLHATATSQEAATTVATVLT